MLCVFYSEWPQKRRYFVNFDFTLSFRMCH